MRVYESKEALKTEINKAFEKYISEFDSIPENLKDKRVDEVDRNPAENLAYQVGWTSLDLKWERDERKGIPVKTPSDDFKWNQLGELYQWFTDTYAHLTLQELKAQLKGNVNSICAMIDSLLLRYSVRISEIFNNTRLRLIKSTAKSRQKKYAIYRNIRLEIYIYIYRYNEQSVPFEV